MRSSVLSFSPFLKRAKMSSAAFLESASVFFFLTAFCLPLMALTSLSVSWIALICSMCFLCSSSAAFLHSMNLACASSACYLRVSASS